ncbi:expressed unknown protein [Seminavis robusta]|uniref:Tetratricopeptide repeat protein n=1 Tax=Seminavis robusta TaxID=568900 RepID=A0A9N8E4I1_9STRA|nr:expressed unknown protein [Seminavis robusta]|eukprot:Sro535_g162000.1 n/a (427) ;mRNA; r:46880-48712
MRFSNLVVAAFVGSQGRNVDLATMGSSGLHLFSPLTPPTELATPVDPSESVIIDLSTQKLNANELPGYTGENAPLEQGIREWLVPSALAEEAGPPTQEEIKLLREAFATFYGVDRDLQKSEQLLSKVIEAWQRQPPDEKAGLYRVRGDCYMALLQPQKAEKDYAQAIEYLQGPGGEQADPTELPTALLGRARAVRSQGRAASQAQLEQTAKDYQLSLRLSSKEEWDTDAENEEDGAGRNPYAAWEWGTALRSKGDLAGAAKVHKLAADSFNDIGDKARAIISEMDAGIDIAALGRTSEAKTQITAAIQNMKKIEGGEVDLLQRVLAKEGESRIALASVLWDSGDKQEAESMLGSACYRMEQMEADAQKRSIKMPPPNADRLKFSIDDQQGVGISCSRFRNEKFLTETMNWPESLQKKVNKLQALGK